MNGSYVMPLWLWLVIVALVLSVVIPAIIRMFRKSLPNDENLIEIGKLVNGLLNPLQLDTIRLAQELEKLSRWPGGTIAAFLANTMFPDPKHNEWALKTVGKYALDFAPRVKNIVLRFGAEGMVEPELKQYFDTVPNVQTISRIAACLVCLAYRKNGISLMPWKSE
jgi:hypothetical protein